MMLPIAVILVAVFHGALAGPSNTTGVVTGGSCKKPTLVKTIDIEQYKGVWYEIQRFPNGFEENLQCVQAYYARIEDKAGGRPQILVRNAGRKGSGTAGEQVTINGTAFLSIFPGTLKVKFANAAPFYAKYQVIDTDYTSYACVYSCTNFLFFKVEFAWILSRTRILAADKLTAARAKYSAAGIDVSKFDIQSILQSDTDCKYVLDDNGNVVTY